MSGKIITMSEAIENLKKYVKYMREEKKKRNEEEYKELEWLIKMDEERLDDYG